MNGVVIGRWVTLLDKPTGKAGYWLTSGHIRTLTGFRTHTAVHNMVSRGELPPAEIKLGRTPLWDRVAIKQACERNGIEMVVDYRTLGFKKPQFDPETDEIYQIHDVMEFLGGLENRPEFQKRLKNDPHSLPRPDFAPGRPLPQYWLRSSLINWLEAEKPIRTFHQKDKDLYELEFGQKRLGLIQKQERGTRFKRKRSGELVEEDVVAWVVTQCYRCHACEGKEFKTRKAAAIHIIEHQHQNSVIWS